MDGTGKLFAGFVAVLPNTVPAQVAHYPADIFLFYTELAPLVQSAIPANEPFVLLAESFSTPLAIQFAAMHPPNLKGLILCAGFASSPRRGLARVLARMAVPFLFRGTLPAFADPLLLGLNAPLSLRASLQSAVSSVASPVLAARFRAILACDMRADLSRVDVPILYMRATHDRVVPLFCLEEILKIKPMTEVACIDGPHLLLQREPQKAAEVATRFIRQLETSD